MKGLFVDDTLQLKAYCKDFWIYVLECENGYYYIGLSANIEQRLSDHFQNLGSLFTQAHKPLRVIEKNHIIFMGSTPCQRPCQEENRKTEEYIKKYGFERVCGGKYLYRNRKYILEN